MPDNFEPSPRINTFSTLSFSSTFGTSSSQPANDGYVFQDGETYIFEDSETYIFN